MSNEQRGNNENFIIEPRANQEKFIKLTRGWVEKYIKYSADKRIISTFNFI